VALSGTIITLTSFALVQARGDIRTMDAAIRGLLGPEYGCCCTDDDDRNPIATQIVDALPMSEDQVPGFYHDHYFGEAERDLIDFSGDSRAMQCEARIEDMCIVSGGPLGMSSNAQKSPSPSRRTSGGASGGLTMEGSAGSSKLVSQSSSFATSAADERTYSCALWGMGGEFEKGRSIDDEAKMHQDVLDKLTKQWCEQHPERNAARMHDWAPEARERSGSGTSSECRPMHLSAEERSLARAGRVHIPEDNLASLQPSELTHSRCSLDSVMEGSTQMVR